jgi:hypothetical protein
MSKFYSQFEEDKWIVDHLSFPENGFFIEIGCGADGILNSNTKYFEDIGWDGFLIEADPTAINLIKQCRAAPVLNYSVSNINNVFIDFYINRDKQLSGILRKEGKKIHSKSMRLKDLLSSLGCQRHIDLLSIDTEGTEIDIIDSMDSIRPTIMIVEYNTMLIKIELNEIVNKLLFLNYNIKHITKCNVIAVHQKI